MRWAVKVYDFLNRIWSNKFTDQSISWLLIGTFFLGLLIITSSKLLGIPELSDTTNYFLAIDLSFQVLLIIEILGLILQPQNAAQCTLKQKNIRKRPKNASFSIAHWLLDLLHDKTQRIIHATSL